MSGFNPFDDIDSLETKEWLESIDSVLEQHGPERAHFLLNHMIDYARRSGAYLPYSPNTAYLNSISTARQPDYPGDRSLEKRIEAYIRWNAMAMVVQANKVSSEFGGHLSSYASSATLYEVGFNHFWRADSEQQRGDMIFMQGHSSPGIYARSFPGRAHGRERPEALSSGSRWRGLVLISASLVDAGLLAIPDRIDGTGSDDGDLPGALHALHGKPRHG